MQTRRKRRKKQVAGDFLAYLGRDGVQVIGTLGDSALENKLKQQWGQQAQSGLSQMGEVLSGGTYLQATITYNNTARGWSGDPVAEIVDKAMKLPCLESGVRKITFEEEET